MWTYELVIKPKFFAETKQLVEKLNKIPDVKVEIIKTKLNLIVFISAKNLHKIKESVLTNVAFFIVNTYKNYYFKNLLKSQNLPQLHLACLSKALTLFDIESDIFLTLTQILPSGKLFVESFYVFRLAKLRAKWQEFGYVCNLNSQLLYNSEIYVEFLKFLYSCIIPQIDEVNVYIEEREFIILDKNKSQLTAPLSLKDEMGLITNLIYLAPKNVNLHCINEISNKTFKRLYYIFNKKINLI